MKAVWYERTGPAQEVLMYGELPTPSPAAGEVLVRLYASGVNPSDVKARAGVRRDGVGMAYARVIPHSDGAGVIEAVGASVPADLVGQRVWLTNAQWQRAEGTAAQYVALPRSLVAPLPDNIPFSVGAALGIPAVTACHCVFNGGDVTGRTVLINGGAGTVGRLAVQLALSSGAFVIATAHGESELARARSTGAHAVLDFADPGLAAAILAANGGRPVDRIVEVEFGCNAEVDAEVIKPRGTIVSYGSALVQRPELPFYPLMFKGVRLELVLVYLLTDTERSAAVERINVALSSGALDVPIHAVFQLERCAEAHQTVEAGGRNGAVIVAIE